MKFMWLSVFEGTDFRGRALWGVPAKKDTAIFSARFVSCE